jgi:hypothetical protein
MSFIRKDLSGPLKQWREPLIWTVLVLTGLALLWRGMARDAAWLLLPGGAAVVTGLLVLPGAVGRARLRALPPGEGLLELDERRIAYFGPLSGGVLDLETITRVEVVAGISPVWRLSGKAGNVLDIPFAARGAERLPDALSALPGIAIAAGISAIDDPTGRSRIIWQSEDP